MRCIDSITESMEKNLRKLLEDRGTKDTRDALRIRKYLTMRIQMLGHDISSVLLMATSIACAGCLMLGFYGKRKQSVPSAGNTDNMHCC